MQNGSLESFNATFRDACLNVHWFRSLADARQTITAWKERDTTERPHSALGGRTPRESAADPNLLASLTECLDTLMDSGQTD